MREEKKAEVFLHPDEVSLAIGKGGLNIRLAIMLTGYAIDVYRDIEEGEEDIYLDEFRDEIDEWVIEALKDLGLGTAKAVLNAPARCLTRPTSRTPLSSMCLRCSVPNSRTEPPAPTSFHSARGQTFHSKH